MSKEKTFYIIHINCKCGANIYPRQNKPKAKWGGAICPSCRKNVGLMGWQIYDKIKAKNEMEAYQLYKEKRDKGFYTGQNSHER